MNIYTVRSDRTCFKFRLNNKDVKIIDYIEIGETIKIYTPKNWCQSKLERVRDYLYSKFMVNIMWVNR